MNYAIIALIVSTWFSITPVATSSIYAVPQAFICIAQHESGFNQFNKNGTPLMSSTGDEGVLQINLKTWKPLADKMGLDLANPKDNITFGIWLYNNKGPQIWTTYKPYCQATNTS